MAVTMDNVRRKVSSLFGGHFLFHVPQKTCYAKIQHNSCTFIKAKSALTGLKQILVNEIPVKIMKNVFYFTLKTI